MKKREKKLRNNKPMLATLIDQPFDNEEWIFEIKLDGFRAMAELDGEKVKIYSRNLLSFNERFPSLVQECKHLQLDAIFDGEIVALDKKGISHFQLLQNYKKEIQVFYYVFDILYLDGQDLCSLPLWERKQYLRSVLPHQKDSLIRYLDHIEKEGMQCFSFCKKRGLEGLIAKKKESPYLRGKRSKYWLKIKTEKRQEVVICGFTEPTGSRKEFGSLLVGVYRKNQLHFAGHVGGGFTESQLKEIKTLLSPLAISDCPFAVTPKTNTTATWVQPYYLCEVKFKEWTKEGILRMPIFLGIRTDKKVQDVVQE